MVYYTPETNTTLQINYTSNKNKSHLSIREIPVKIVVVAELIHPSCIPLFINKY